MTMGSTTTLCLLSVFLLLLLTSSISFGHGMAAFFVQQQPSRTTNTRKGEQQQQQHVIIAGLLLVTTTTTTPNVHQPQQPQPQQQQRWPVKEDAAFLMSVKSSSSSCRLDTPGTTTSTCGQDNDNGDYRPLNNQGEGDEAILDDDDAASSQRRRDLTRMCFLAGVMTSPLVLVPFQQQQRHSSSATGPRAVAAAAAYAADPSSLFYQEAESKLTMAAGLLDSRVTENVLSPPPYGMEGDGDIFYPSWFAGTWSVQSIATDVQAPCGVALFTGGNKTFIKARSEIGQVLRYQSRFLPLPSASAAGSISSNSDGSTSVANSSSASRCIADREYNVRSIAKAAMGPNSVVDIPLSSPNKISCILALPGAPSLLRVDLITLNRRQEQDDDDDKNGIASRRPRFDCSEVVREIVAPIGNSNNNSPQSLSLQQTTTTASVLKEVETTSLYTYDKVKDEIHCRQRSASFLLPSQQSPMAMKMWEAARGRPVDVRFYDVLYTRPAVVAKR